MTLWTQVSTGRSSARVWRGNGVHRKEGPTTEIAEAERAGWSSARLLAELRAIRPAAEDLVVGHGDLCLPNILADEAGHITGVVDVGRLGVADRHNDLAIATRSIAAAWSSAAGAGFLHAYGLREPDPAKIAFYRLLDEFF